MKAKILHSREGQYINVIGDNQYIKLTGEETAGAYTLIEEINPPVRASLSIFTRTRMRHFTSWKGRWNSRWTESP